NWRDIFQNWEALALAFPEYIESMITKFVNSSTADGYNPFRVTRTGFEWDVLDAADPRSYVGYWGDHQIIYLLKLLELSVKYHPGKLQTLLSSAIFRYANVPYRIKPYHDLIRDPHHTIDFAQELDAAIEKRVETIGEDGKSVQTADGEVYHVNLAEKLLVPLLVKFSNFIPEAGIWMNTQRPEWNDANNALVGYGTSMVTVYYLRRFTVFCLELFKEMPVESIEISEEVAGLFAEIKNSMDHFRDLLRAPISDTDRKRITDRLGQAGSDHRTKIYDQGFSGIRSAVSLADLIAFLQTSLKYIDHSIKANQRHDDLYHAYNLIKFTDQNAISVRHLYEMLEGQVAVLHSGFLPSEEALILLNALKKSALYRKDQSSYILYPNRQLPRFMDKNVIPKDMVGKSALLQSLVQQGDRSIIIPDINRNYHFNGNLHNSRILKKTLQNLHGDGKPAVESDHRFILQLYESVFDHQSFTGRSGTFYKYEGLGSIYWHMVSKLLQAVQDAFYRAKEAQANSSILEKLKHHYYEIRAGIGVHKNPALYGAFPTDPYSHTPENRGAQQPGMTGQVKEDIISRFGELGVEVREGRIRFNPALLDKNEFLIKSMVFPFYDVNEKQQTLMLSQGMLAFTLCQVPVIYIMANRKMLVITYEDGSEQEVEGLEIGEAVSITIFRREGKITQIQVLMNLSGENNAAENGSNENK
ncbi:MAG: hypothetical protein WAN36_15115, partial [Calditrichia bacterium]